MSLTLFDFDAEPVEEPIPPASHPQYLDGCSRQFGHRCGECRMGLGRHCHLDPKCDLRGKYTYCLTCMQQGKGGVAFEWTDDRRYLRAHLAQEHGVRYGDQSGTCADPQPYARLVVDGAQDPAPRATLNFPERKETVAENTATVEDTAADVKPVRVKKDPATILPNVPSEYKNPETGRYLPGRDARHASDVAKAIIGGANEDKALAALGSDVLRAKALKQVENHNERLAKQGTEGEVTVRGEVYDARKVRGTGVVRYDGPKGWVEVEADSKIAASFQSRADLDKAAAAEGEAEDADESTDAE